jgi:hypothetical protein
MFASSQASRTRIPLASLLAGRPARIELVPPSQEITRRSVAASRAASYHHAGVTQNIV